MNKKVFALIALLCIGFQYSFSQSFKTHWVDSVLASMNVTKKVGQLFLVPVDVNTDAATFNQIEDLIKSHEVGGILLKKGSQLLPPGIISSFQKASDVPLYFGYDGRIETLLDSALGYPEPVILGATSNDTLMYRYGSQLGSQLKDLGINLYFTHVNVSTGPLPALFGTDDVLGENPNRVARKSINLTKGLQDQGITTCAQYFTIKGITVAESKGNKPLLNITVDSTQLIPYLSLIANGVKGIMPAASEFPIFYNDINTIKKKSYNAQTLTSLYTAQWLKDFLSFEGLTFVNTAPITALPTGDKEGEAELQAFIAGNDVLMSEDIGAAIRKIKRLVRKDDQFLNQLDHSVRKILAAKFDAGLWKKNEDLFMNATPTLTVLETKLVNKKIHDNAITVLKNDENSIPIKTLDNRNFAYIATYPTEKNHAVYEYLSKYTSFSNHTVEDKTDELSLVKTLSNHQVIVVGVFNRTPDASLERLNRVFAQLTHEPEIIYCDFGNATLLRTAFKYKNVITAYRESELTYIGLPQVLFGGLPARGVLPFSFTALIKEGTGIKTNSLNRLTYTVPEDAGMDSRVLHRIDLIVKEAIAIGATPGCQVYVARKGKVIYDKSFGFLTYDKKYPVTNETIYDLASITKVSATLQTAMFMHDHGLLDLNKKISVYLPELKKTNKKDITVIDMLTHQSGLLPFIPMYPSTVKDTTYLPLYYSRKQSEKYPFQVADRLYGSPTLKDSVWVWIMNTKLLDKPVRTPYAYKYSDLGFLILQRIAEKVLNQPMDEFLTQNLYEPLGGNTLVFNPLTKFNKQTIAPTEDDKIFRRSFVSGTVHDERAAMLGGVAGHAGLFGTANDLGKLGQMWLQEGNYGGIQYYKPETVRLFTAQRYKTSRRGIGWDRPLQSDPNSPTSLYASQATFGHTGFTGTAIWVDPVFDLVYIFLSNRVYPDRNAKLINANIRPRIQDVIYKSIFSYQEMEKPVYFVNELATIKPLENRP